MKKRYHRALTIAGSDCSGGAGIQADLKTFSALGCYGMSVITALTAQNTMGVSAIHPLPAGFVREQIEVLLNDIGADAIKIGMLYSEELIRTVAGQLKNHPGPHIVLDPVMVSQSGHKLIEEGALEALKGDLIPLSTVLTPNIPEASMLLGRELQDLSDREEAARDLARYGAKSVLLKGGHLSGNESSDLLFIASENRVVILPGERIPTRNNHGTGCTLSSAVASFLARGLPLEEAVRQSKEYITGAIRAGAEYEIGKGHGPVHHYFRFW